MLEEAKDLRAPAGLMSAHDLDMLMMNIITPGLDRNVQLLEDARGIIGAEEA